MTDVLQVALLTGGSDKPYALGLASALAASGVAIDFIGSNELDCAEVHAIPLTFLNLRGDQQQDVALSLKVVRILRYYTRLLLYAARQDVSILHILWNNKFELFDRTLLMAYYRTTGKRVVLTAHNVNTAARDQRDTWLNRWSLRVQYRLCDHVFVHTDAMKQQLVTAFGVSEQRVTVIPFGLNDTIPKTGLTQEAARQTLGLHRKQRVLLFFGQIAPYKGLAHLVEAIARLAERGEPVNLVVAGKVKRGNESYWEEVRQAISARGIDHLVHRRIQFVPDAEVEPYFKAADAVVMPYVEIYQSGVPFLAFSFGLPVIATDVGSLREDITSENGVLCQAQDPADLARAITEFYGSRLHRNATYVRHRIRRLAEERHSWSIVSERTCAVYARLVAPTSRSSVRRASRRGAAQSECRE